MFDVMGTTGQAGGADEILRVDVTDAASLGRKSLGVAQDLAAKLTDLYVAIDEGRRVFPRGSGERHRGKITPDGTLRRPVGGADR